MLMGDDGIAPFVVKILESMYDFRAEVVLHDLGTPGLGIMSFFADYDAIVLLDAVKAKGLPAEVKLYRKQQLVRVLIPRRVSPHDPALVEALLFSECSGKCPREVLLVGIVPESVELGCCLTKAVQSAVAPAISAVLADLHRLGVQTKLRHDGAQPSIWWTEQVSCPSSLGESPDVPGYSG
jgi:hydrogenase maturation protease